MNDGNIAHFAFYHEAEACRQIAFQERPVNVAGVIGDHNTAIRWQIVDTSHCDLDAGEHEDHFGSEGDQFLPAMHAGHEYRDNE
jgi:hypothetical protein